MKNLILLLFKTSILIFLVTGFVLVIGQFLSLLSLQGPIIQSLHDTLSPITYITTSVASLLGLSLYYFKDKEA